MSHDHDDEILTTPDAAKYLTKSTTWLYKNREAQGIPHMRIGKELRYRKSALRRWMIGRERE